MNVVWRNKLGGKYVSIPVRDSEDARAVIRKEMQGVDGELSTFGDVGDSITIEASDE